MDDVRWIHQGDDGRFVQKVLDDGREIDVHPILFGWRVGIGRGGYSDMY